MNKMNETEEFFGTVLKTRDGKHEFLVTQLAIYDDELDSVVLEEVNGGTRFNEIAIHKDFDLLASIFRVDSIDDLSKKFKIKGDVYRVEGVSKYQGTVGLTEVGGSGEIEAYERLDDKILYPNGDMVGVCLISYLKEIAEQVE